VGEIGDDQFLARVARRGIGEIGGAQRAVSFDQPRPQPGSERTGGAGQHHRSLIAHRHRSLSFYYRSMSNYRAVSAAPSLSNIGTKRLRAEYASFRYGLFAMLLRRPSEGDAAGRIGCQTTTILATIAALSRRHRPRRGSGSIAG